MNELHEVFDLAMSDEISAWDLNSDSQWIRTTSGPSGHLADYQDMLMQRTLEKKKLR
jgi:polyphosphate kinase